MESYSVALTDGKRLEYEARNGWNLELTYDGNGKVMALYRLVKTGRHLSLEPTPDDLIEVEQGKYTAYKIACDLDRTCFVINPNEYNTAWREYYAYTLEELRFHMQRLGSQLPPVTDWMLKTMREAKEAVREHTKDLQQAEQKLWTDILKEAGIKPEVFEGGISSRIINEELVRGYSVRRLITRLQSDHFLRILQVFQAIQEKSPGIVLHSNADAGAIEPMETWLIRNPAAILQQETNLSHSALAMRNFHRGISHMDFVVAVAKLYPLPEIFKPMEEQASFIKHHKSYKPPVEEAVCAL